MIQTSKNIRCVNSNLEGDCVSVKRPSRIIVEGSKEEASIELVVTRLEAGGERSESFESEAKEAESAESSNIS